MFLGKRGQASIEYLIIAGFVAPINACRLKPTYYGFRAYSKEQSHDNRDQLPYQVLMEDKAKSDDHYLPAIRKNPFGKHRLSLTNMCFFT